MDRNLRLVYVLKGPVWSLSARRAWIEIENPPHEYFVAMSLSARRAWIEMRLRLTVSYILASRSPQGERG